MNYSELIELGFKRTDVSDNVHFNEFGFQCFFLTYDISRKHQLYWDVTEKDEVLLYRYESDGQAIKDTLVIKDIQVVADLIRMFG